MSHRSALTGGYRENGILVFCEVIESEGSTTLVMPTPSGRGHFSHSVGAIRIWVTSVVESLSPGLHSCLVATASMEAKEVNPRLQLKVDKKKLKLAASSSSEVT